ncbi:MAG: cell division protein FtsA [Candidatus Niyogibacteria bacterium]|nr:cell division protein FtsA [Candidatus Niyogibacteria bacterium]
MGKNIVIGIDIGTSSIKTIVVEKEKGKTPRVLGVGEAASLGVRKGSVIDVAEVSEAAAASRREAEKSSGITIKHAYISLGGLGLSSLRQKGVVAASRADNEITEYDIKRVVEVCRSPVALLANKSVIDAHPLFFTVDGELVSQNPLGLVGTRLEAETMFTVGLTPHLNNLIKSMEGAKIAIDDVVASPFAASLAVLSKKHKEAGVALLNLGAMTASLAVFEENLPLSLEIFSIGSSHITNDIAVGFQLSMEEAEKLKCNFATEKARKAKLTDIIDARLFDIFELVEKHLKKIGRSRLLPAGIVITGGGANLTDLAEFSRRELQLPAQIGLPQNIHCDYSRFQDPKWSVAAGLCLYGFEDEKGYAAFPGIKGIKGAGNFLSRWLRAFLP